VGMLSLLPNLKQGLIRVDLVNRVQDKRRETQTLRPSKTARDRAPESSKSFIRMRHPPNPRNRANTLRLTDGEKK
jgi:hypothetical protein